MLAQTGPDHITLALVLSPEASRALGTSLLSPQCPVQLLVVHPSVKGGIPRSKGMSYIKLLYKDLPPPPFALNLHRPVTSTSPAVPTQLPQPSILIDHLDPHLTQVPS